MTNAKPMALPHPMGSLTSQEANKIAVRGLQPTAIAACVGVTNRKPLMKHHIISAPPGKERNSSAPHP